MTDRSLNKIAAYAQLRRKQGRTRKIVLLVALVVLLAVLAWAGMYYAANRRLPFPAVGPIASEAEAPPQFLYAISGPEGSGSLQKPVGVAVNEDGRLFVVDAFSRVVRVYEADDGEYLFSFGQVTTDRGDALRLPQRVTIGPDGNVWVTDRHLRGVFVFSADDGSFIREWVPKGEITETWSPVALAFDAEDNLWVADLGVSENHQVISFDLEGNERVRWGSTVQATRMSESPGGFYYPNGIAFSEEGDVFVSDMSNHRVQVFTTEGEFKHFIYTSGSPLGLVIDRAQRVSVVDPFAHSVDIYQLEGERITGFGGSGLGLGQFRFPSDITLDETGRIFVSDRENNQVQVWGWPTGLIPPVTLPEDPSQWLLCLSPLLLLLIPLLRRRTAFVATEDFIEAMIGAGAVSQMSDRRFKWVVTQELHEQYRDRAAEEVKLDELLDGQPYSRTDVEDFIERSGADERSAVLLTMAERVGRLATQDAELAEAARALDILVVDGQGFLASFANRGSRRAGRDGEDTR